MQTEINPEIAGYLYHLKLRNFTEETIGVRGRYLSYYEKWCLEKGITNLLEVRKEAAFEYQQFTAVYKRKKDSENLSLQSQIKRVCAVKCFYQYLSESGRIEKSPFEFIQLKRSRRYADQLSLSAQEVEEVLSQIEVNTSLGMRNRAILELMYSTGLRRSEIANLNLYDIDMKEGSLTVRKGKGQKDRMVPVGSRAIGWIEKYLRHVRPHLVRDNGVESLFLGKLGNGLNKQSITCIARMYMRMSEQKIGSCHIFRHTAATLMLRNGADIKSISEMLGHSGLLSTQGYTHVEIEKLKEAHRKAHPTCYTEEV